MKFRNMAWSGVLLCMAIAAVLAFGTVDNSIAHTGATGVVKKRMDSMKAIASSLKNLVDMQREKRPFDAATAAQAGRAIASHAQKLGAMFPPGSNKHPSESAPEIWTKRSEFDAMMQAMQKAGEALSTRAKAAISAKDIAVEFRQLVSTCQACHAKFRSKEHNH